MNRKKWVPLTATVPVAVLQGWSHEHLTPIEGTQEINGRWQVLIPVYTGGTLQSRLTAQSLTAEKFAYIIEQLAHTLDFIAPDQAIFPNLSATQIEFDKAGQFYLPTHQVRFCKLSVAAISEVNIRTLGNLLLLMLTGHPNFKTARQSDDWTDLLPEYQRIFERALDPHTTSPFVALSDLVDDLWTAVAPSDINSHRHAYQSVRSTPMNSAHSAQIPSGQERQRSPSRSLESSPSVIEIFKGILFVLWFMAGICDNTNFSNSRPPVVSTTSQPTRVVRVTPLPTSTLIENPHTFLATRVVPATPSPTPIEDAHILPKYTERNIAGRYGEIQKLDPLPHNLNDNTLTFNPNEAPPIDTADVNLRDFILKVVVYNPDVPPGTPWDITFMWREHPQTTDYLQLTITSNGIWQLTNPQGEVGSGNLSSSWHSPPGDRNVYTLIALREQGYLLVNGHPQPLDLTQYLIWGDISLSTGRTLADYQGEPIVLHYESVELWQIPVDEVEGGSSNASNR